MSGFEIEIDDMFKNLGSVTAGGLPKDPFIDGLGHYSVEILSFRKWESESPNTLGHTMVKLQGLIQEVHYDYAYAEAKSHGDRFEPSHPVGYTGCVLWNITKNSYARKDIRGVIDGLVPHLAEILSNEELTKFAEYEAAGGDVHAALASLVTRGDGTRTQGCLIGLSVVPSQDGYRQTSFATPDVVKARAQAAHRARDTSAKASPAPSDEAGASSDLDADIPF